MESLKDLGRYSIYHFIISDCRNNMVLEYMILRYFTLARRIICKYTHKFLTEINDQYLFMK